MQRVYTFFVIFSSSKSGPKDLVSSVIDQKFYLIGISIVFLKLEEKLPKSKNGKMCNKLHFSNLDLSPKLYIST